MAASASLGAPPEGASPWRRVGVLALGVLVVGLVVLATDVLLLLFAGLLLALVLHGLSALVSRHLHVRYGIVLTALVLGGLAGAIAFVALLAPSVADQAQALARRLPRAIASVREWLTHVPLVRPSSVPAPQEMKPEAKSLAAGAFAAANTTIEIVGGAIVIFFVGVYGAAQPAVYERIAVQAAPERYRSRVQRSLAYAMHNLTRWLLGRLVAMLFVFTTTAIAFSVLGVPLPMTLAVLAGLLTFIEYVGAIVSAIPPVLLAFTVSPTLALAVLAVFTGVHLVEGYLLTPLLARASVKIPPAFTIAGQVLLASLVGPLALTFATPLLVVIAATVKAWREEGEGEGEAKADANA